MGDMAEFYDYMRHVTWEWCEIHEEWFETYLGCLDCEDGEPTKAQQEFSPDE